MDSAYLCVGPASTGRKVATGSGEDWGHTPEYDGFCTMLGTT
jgi:hypothetical protein